jgi:hypothetical protein
MAANAGMKIAEGPVDLASLKKQCYPIIEPLAPSTINWGNLIGSGTYGLILGTIVEPDKWVVKVADKTTSCTTMNHEINLHESAIKALQTFKEAQRDLPVFCPGIARFAHKDKCCWYYMQKIYKPQDFSKLIHTTIEDVDPGEPRETEEKWSGIFPSPGDLNQIIKHFTRSGISNLGAIENVARLNGTIFGILHYLSKQTGQDIEITLGKMGKNQPITVIFFDFDKSGFWHEVNEDQYQIQNNSEILTKNQFIKVLSNSMTNAYCTTMGDIGKQFSEGYQAIAEMVGLGDIAIKTLNNIKELEEMLQGGRRRRRRRRRRKSRKKKRKTKKKKRRKKRKTRRRRK